MSVVEPEHAKPSGQDKARSGLTSLGRVLGHLALFAVLAGGLAVIAFNVAQAMTTSATSSPCSVKNPDPSPQPPTTPASLTLRAGQDTTLPFGRGQGSAPLSLELDVAATADPSDTLTRKSVLNVVATPFRKVGTSTEIRTTGPDPATVEAAAYYIGDTLTIRWCANRSEGATAGTYSGELVVDDPRANPLTIPVTLTLSDNNTEWVATLLPVLGLVGLLMSWNIRLSHPPSSELITKKFWTWLLTIEGVGALVVGSGAMVTVFWNSYLSAPTFGSSGLDYLTLVAAMYASFVGAAATVNVLSVPGRKDEAQPVAKD